MGKYPGGLDSLVSESERVKQKSFGGQTGTCISNYLGSGQQPFNQSTSKTEWTLTMLDCLSLFEIVTKYDLYLSPLFFTSPVPINTSRRSDQQEEFNVTRAIIIHRKYKIIQARTFIGIQMAKAAWCQLNHSVRPIKNWINWVIGINALGKY